MTLALAPDLAAPRSPIIISIMGPLIGKGRARMTRTGHAYTPEKTRREEGYIRLLATQAMQGQPAIEGPVALCLLVQRQPPSSWSKRRQQGALLQEFHPTARPDIDNVLKAILDAANGVIWRDDSQVVRIEASKRYGPQDVTIVDVREIEAGRGGMAPR